MTTIAPVNASFRYSLKAPLNEWLKLQSEGLAICTQAVLVNMIAEARYQILAQWPQVNAALNSKLELAISQVMEKQRLHLSQIDADNLLLCHPVTLNGKFWGAVIFAVRCSDKKTLPAVVKKIQMGLVRLLPQIEHAPKPVVRPISSVTKKPTVVPSASEHQTTINESQEHAGQTEAQPVSQKSIVQSQANQEPVNIAPQDEQLLQAFSKVMQEKSLRESAITLVNLLATRLLATQVSLGLSYRKKLQMEAISFSANFDQRTQPVQAVLQTMEEAIEQDSDIRFSTDAEKNSVDIKIVRCHEKLVTDNQLKSVQTLLLRDNNKVIGAITVEHNNLTGLAPKQQVFLEQLLAMSAQIISLKMAAEFGVLQRAKTLGGSWLDRRLGEKSVVKKLLYAALLVAVLVLFIPLQYHISNEATLQGASKNLLVSPQDGILKIINARPGDKVKKGDVLAQLNDDDLHVERRKVSSQMQQYQQEYDNALANSNRAQAAIASAQVDQASAQLQLIDQELSRTQLLAPADGIIVSDDISQTLGAPVKQGQLLFEIAAAKGFLVQIFVDERDIAAVKTGQQGQLKLTSLPGEVLLFTVKAITPISQVREGRNYFRVEANLSGESDLLRPGMTGTAKIAAGKHFLGWIWFHDLWHWFRLKLWW